MSTSTAVRTSHSAASQRSGRLGGICLALGGVAFFAGGVTHPSDSGGTTKVAQLYEAFVQSSWYPSHALLLVSFALFAAAILQLRRRDDLGPAMARLVNVVSVVAVVATVGMAVHLLSALGAASIADGQPSLVSHVATWNETIISTLWGLGIIALAVAGGLTRTLGSRITMPLGVVGGVAWCMATATIAFTDRFDTLFPIAGSLITVWAVAAGAKWKSSAETMVAEPRTTPAQDARTATTRVPTGSKRVGVLAAVLLTALVVLGFWAATRPVPAPDPGVSSPAATYRDSGITQAVREHKAAAQANAYDSGITQAVRERDQALKAHRDSGIERALRERDEAFQAHRDSGILRALRELEHAR